MTTLTSSEAAARLPQLLEQGESVVIRDGEDNVAIFMRLPRPHRTAADRKAAWVRLDAISQQASEDLARDLARDGITVDEFLADALADD